MKKGSIARTVRHTIIIAMIFLMPIGLILSAPAYIGDFVVETYIPGRESAEVSIVDNDKGNEQIIFGATSHPFNCQVSNDSSNSLFVFLEFLSPYVGSDPLYTPVAGEHWVLVTDENDVTIDDITYRQYLLAYSEDGANMTELAYGTKSAAAFSSIEVLSISDETTYLGLETQFKVAVRSVVTTSNDGSIENAWAQVPKAYSKNAAGS